MKTMQKYTHPLTLYHQRIKEEGVVVLNDARGLPTAGGEPFVSSNYVICIVHRGRMDLMYDDIPDFTEHHTVGVIFPNHALTTVSMTDDYVATLVVVDASLLDDPMLRVINQMRYRYEPHPAVKLDKHQYRMIMNTVELMQENSRLNLAERKMIHVRQLWFLLRLLGAYRHINMNESNTEKRIGELFRNNIEQHFRQHREVGFYANLACLSAKHFSTVVKQETGHTAAFWIHSRVVAEAKLLLHVRQDLNMQAIADKLGFVDQASFCRFFKRETGVTPTGWRQHKL